METLLVGLDLGHLLLIGKNTSLMLILYVFQVQPMCNYSPKGLTQSEIYIEYFTCIKHFIFKLRS